MNARVAPFLAVALVFCALFVVKSQHEARRLFIELERAQGSARQLEIEWKQFEVEQSRLSQHGRIEAIAKRDLNMVAVTPASTHYLAAGAK